MRHKIVRSTFVAVLVITTSVLTIQFSRTALASGDVGCNPQRANDFGTGKSGMPYYRLDGWQYPTWDSGYTQAIGGVYATIPTYANYSDTSASDYDYQWVWLGNDLDARYQSNNSPLQTNHAEWAQVGPLTGALLSARGLENYSLTSGNDSAFVAVQVTGPNFLDGGVLTVWSNSQMATWLNVSSFSLPPGSSATYAVLYGNAGPGELTMQVNGRDIDFPTTGNPPQSYYEYQIDTGNSLSTDWYPTQAEISGETHSGADQMFGDTGQPEDYTNAHFYLSGWLPLSVGNMFNVSSPDPYTQSPTKYGSNPQFGYTNPSGVDTSFSIWDTACPPPASDLFVTTGTNGGDVYYNFNSGSGWGTSWTSLGSPGNIPANERLTAVSLSPGTEDVFTTTTSGGSPGDVYYDFWNGSSWSGWNAISATTASIAAVSRSESTIDLLAIGSNGEVYCDHWPNGGPWSGWSNVSASIFPTTASLSAASMSSGTFGVYVQGNDKNFYSEYWNGSWSPSWSNLGMPTSGTTATASIAAMSPTTGSEYLYASTGNSSSNVYYDYWNGSSWGGWGDSGNGASLSSTATITSFSEPLTTATIFTPGANGNVYDDFGNGAGWYGWNSMSYPSAGITQTSSVAAVSPDYYNGRS